MLMSEVTCGTQQRSFCLLESRVKRSTFNAFIGTVHRL